MLKRNGVYKARFVVRGDKQQPRIDYEYTFATIVRLETFRTVLALIAAWGLEAYSFDVVIAFMNAPIKAPSLIYVAPPKGYETKDDDGQLLVWLLRRVLNGLKQWARLWYLEILSTMKKYGFFPLPSDPCLL